MSSRQEEKERRRQERLEQERQHAAVATRTRRLQIIGGIVVAAAVVAVVVVLVVSRDGGAAGESATAPGAPAIALPAQRITDLQEAADASGCKVQEHPSEGQGHETGVQRYRTNPPTSGTHSPVPGEDGIYDPGNSPPKEAFVHTLEHGRVIMQYRPGVPARTRQVLEAIFNEPVNGTPGYHAVVAENNTKMPYAVAATAWTRSLTCPRMNAEVIDAMRAFRAQYTDKAPEFIP